MTMRVFLELSVALMVALSVVNAGDVLVLTDSDFTSKISDLDLVLVKFYAPWCGHCKKIAPEFEKAATVLKDNDPPVALAEVDCTAEGKDTCSQHGVSGYPTLQAFKRGSKAFDYEGPRDSDGIVRYMRGKAGPSSKELKSVADAVKFLSSDDHSIIGFFESASSSENTEFQKLASALSDDFRFAHTFNSDVINKYNHKNTFVIFQSPKLATKLEPSEQVYQDSFNVDKMKSWVLDNVHGLAGYRKSSNTAQFKNPLVVVYYDIDYVKNPKGSNYWRNRVIKVAKELEEAGRRLNFAVSSSTEMSHEISEYGITAPAGDKPVVAARDAADQKYVMSGEFSVEALKQFALDLLDGKLEPYLKSEPVPTSKDGHVEVVVAKNFNSIVNDESKDVLIEFYAPWCGHCKSLAPKYEELAEKLKDESSIVIAKMDATANDVPKLYDVRGFPTLYFVPKGAKKSPKRYEGGREVDDFIKYLARESTDQLTGYDRSGKKTKKSKTEL